MSASINGGSVITFSGSHSTNTSGQLVLQGSGNGYTIQIYKDFNGPGTYTLSSYSVGNYATVATSSGTYFTGTTSTGQIALTSNGTTGNYNGTFYFAALNNGNSIVVSNGQFTNM